MAVNQSGWLHDPCISDMFCGYFKVKIAIIENVSPCMHYRTQDHDIARELAVTDISH